MQIRNVVEAEQRQRDDTGEAGAMCLQRERDAERVTRIERRPIGGPAAVLTLPLLDCDEFRVFDDVPRRRANRRSTTPGSLRKTSPNLFAPAVF